MINFFRYLRIRQQTAYNGNQAGGQGQNQGPPPQIVLPAQGIAKFAVEEFRSSSNFCF